jgi:hypothetical protein
MKSSGKHNLSLNGPDGLVRPRLNAGRQSLIGAIFLALFSSIFQSKIETELNAVGAVRLYGLTFVGTSFIQCELEK